MARAAQGWTPCTSPVDLTEPGFFCNVTGWVSGKIYRKPRVFLWNVRQCCVNFFNTVTLWLWLTRRSKKVLRFVFQLTTRQSSQHFPTIVPQNRWFEMEHPIKLSKCSKIDIFGASLGNLHIWVPTCRHRFDFNTGAEGWWSCRHWAPQPRDHTLAAAAATARKHRSPWHHGIQQKTTTNGEGPPRNMSLCVVQIYN